MNTCQNNSLPIIIIGLLLKILCLPLTNLNKGKLYNKYTFLNCKYLHSQCPSDQTLGEIKWSNNYMPVTVDSWDQLFLSFCPAIFYTITSTTDSRQDKQICRYMYGWRKVCQMDKSVY